MIVIVVGAHRSGTSALAGLLDKSGVIMGTEETFYPPPLNQNPKGFYENYEFRSMNDAVLEACGYRVKSFGLDLPQVQASELFRERMREIIGRYIKKYPSWGWKDPRTCLTLGIWLEEIRKMKLIDECKVVYIYRMPISVSRSLVSRNDTDLESAFRLWEIQNRIALENLDTDDIDTFYMSYEDLMNEPNFIISALFDFLHIESKLSEVANFLDQNLDHSTNENPVIPEKNSFPEGVWEVFDELNHRKVIA